MTPKSPFLIIEDFLSPLTCEEIIENLDLLFPDTDKDGNPVPKINHHEVNELIMFDRIRGIVPQIEQYYEIQYQGTESMAFEWFPEGTEGTVVSENSRYLRKKWLRTENRDITGVVFLCDYQETTPFDSDYEVYGGKLEFPQWQFGFNPRRGTLVLYPSVPNFLNKTTTIKAGELYQVRFHIAAKTVLLFDPKLFPGNYKVWFGNR